MTLKAHPERRGYLSIFSNAPVSQTLQAELSQVRFEGIFNHQIAVHTASRSDHHQTLSPGRPPQTQHEWQNVEQALIERCCGARLREQWVLHFVLLFFLFYLFLVYIVRPRGDHTHTLSFPMIHCGRHCLKTWCQPCLISHHIRINPRTFYRPPQRTNLLLCPFEKSFFVDCDLTF